MVKGIQTFRLFIVLSKKLISGNYSYRIKQNDFNGNFEYFELGSNVTVKAPSVYQVSQSYPNPSNPNSKIDYLLPGFRSLAYT